MKHNLEKILIFVIGIMVGITLAGFIVNPIISDLRKTNSILETELAETRGMLDSTIGRIEMEKYGREYDKP